MTRFVVRKIVPYWNLLLFGDSVETQDVALTDENAVEITDESNVSITVTINV
jgi:hypothetical protein